MNNVSTSRLDSKITARALVKIANALIDDVAGKNPTSENERYLHIGAISGIRDMCAASLDAIPKAPPQRSHQPGDLALSSIPWSTARLGEQKAGTILDVGTGITYDLMLLPGESEDVTWTQAKAIAAAAGGDLPSTAEMLMLERLLGAAAFKSDAYWTIETARFDGDTEDSIQYFTDGVFDFTVPSDQMSMRGVRRVMVDDGTDSNDSNNSSTSQPFEKPGESTVKLPAELWHVVHAACAILESENVPAHFEAAGALRTAMSDFEEVIAIPTPAAGPDLSDRPDLQALRAALFEKVEPVTMEGIAAVLDELNGIMDADDEGDTIKTLAPVIKVINGLILIADMEKLTGGAVEINASTLPSSSATLTPALQQLRAELDPEIQQMYPDLLTTEGVKPTREDVLDVIVKLQAITIIDGVRNVSEFAMEVISGLVAMIDVERLA